MATQKSPRRSVSPFGLREKETGPFTDLEVSFDMAFGKSDSSEKPALQSFAHAVHIPFFVNKIAAAAANDAPELEKLCQFLLVHKVDFEVKGLDAVLFQAMGKLFEKKTEIFLIGDGVLFARERDILVGRYFSPITEKNPGLFSEFVTHWVETDNLDRLLHFLDFSAGSADPTFEHYLIFAHPALKRILTNKNNLQALVKKAEPLIKKLTSSTWEPALCQALEI